MENFIKKGFNLSTIYTACTLEEIEKQINGMQIDHERLNIDTDVEIVIQPEPKTVCFDGYSQKQFNVFLYLIH
ncbi:MAG TPA: hypothetical protein VIM42_11270 [Clostridium sp.]